MAAPPKPKKIAMAQLEKLPNEWYVEEFGAKADAKTINTKMIQRAIDACHEAGGGFVTLRSGVYLSATLQLKDNVTLKVNRGAILRGTIDPMEYINIDPFVDAVGQTRGECLVGAVDAKNVGICGNGVIDGEGEFFKAQLTRKRLVGWNRSEKEVEEFSKVRPFLVRIVRCQGVNIKEINLRNPGAWTCHLFESSKIKVDGISIEAHVNSNNDGIDLDSCNDVVITNCDINTGDDAMCIKSTSAKPCENVTITNCRLRSEWGAIKLGTESMGDYRNIRVSNCEIYDTRGGGIKVLTVDGSNIFDVRFSKINMVNTEMPIFVRLGERLRTYRDAEQRPVGSIDELYFTGITASARSPKESRVSAPAGIFITGTPNARIGRVVMQGITMTLPGGGTAEDAKRIIPEDETRYPEFSFFGIQPASGIHARHIERLEVKSTKFIFTGSDERPLYKYEDINYYENEYPYILE